MKTKFRIYSSTYGMDYGDSDWGLTLKGKLLNRDSDLKNAFVEAHSSFKFELMQFTGLKDKNGKEIYEGDVIRTAEFDRVVEWNVDRFDARWLIESQQKLHEESGLGMPWNTSMYEIVGNIYESPELIKS